MKTNSRKQIKSNVTRDDFEDLDQFYASAWDRLTDDGKAQMSHRVWEGIREGEYQFTDLPDNVKKKEADQLYVMLTGEKPMPEAMKQIPEKDRQDFVLAMDEGNHAKAYSVADRVSFKETASLAPSNKASADNMVENAEIDDKAKSAEQISASAEHTESIEPGGEIHKQEAKAEAYDLDAAFKSPALNPSTDLDSVTSNRSINR